MAKQKIVEAIATKPHSQGTGQHVDAGTWFHGEQAVVDRLIAMGKARYPAKGETPDVGEPDVGEPDVGEPDVGEPDVGEPEVTSRRATRGR